MASRREGPGSADQRLAGAGNASGTRGARGHAGRLAAAVAPSGRGFACWHGGDPGAGVAACRRVSVRGYRRPGALPRRGFRAHGGAAAAASPRDRRRGDPPCRRPGLHAEDLRDGKGRAIVPHGHRNMVSQHLVLQGEMRSRHYERLRDEQEWLVVRPTIDKVFRDFSSLLHRGRWGMGWLGSLAPRRPQRMHFQISSHASSHRTITAPSRLQARR